MSETTVLIGERYRKVRRRDQYVRVTGVSGGRVQYLNLNSQDYGFTTPEIFLQRFHHFPIVTT